MEDGCSTYAIRCSMVSIIMAMFRTKESDYLKIKELYNKYNK